MRNCDHGAVIFGQVMLQPNWHDTGDAAESMTPIVVLGLAYVAAGVLRLGPGARRLFFILVLAELAAYLGLWLWWAFGPAWTRDPFFARADAQSPFVVLPQQAANPK